MSLRLAAFASLCVSLSCPALTSGQTAEAPAQTARFQVGPLGLTPWIALSDVGVDGNVFNESNNPKSDFTMAIGPATNVWLSVGPSRLRGKSSGQYLFFNKYASQRSWSTTNEGRWELPFANFTPFATGTYTSTRQRPSYEIDARVRQRYRSYGLGTDVRLGGRTTLVLASRRSDFTYDDQDVFLGPSLAHSLDRATNMEEVQLRRALTPLTLFVMRAESIRDRFDHEPARDADSIRVTGGFELQPAALISGSGYVGVRVFNPQSSIVPDYRGIVAAVKAKYTIARTRLEVQVNRDLDYSFEATQPYYAITDVGLTATERLSHLWDVVGRVSHQSLGYRSIVGDSGPAGGRVDRGYMVGTGVGYRLGSSLRMGFDLNYFNRNTQSLRVNDYSGLRFGGSVTYGLPRMKTSILALLCALAVSAGTLSAQTDYVIGPQDVLTITVFGEPDYSGKYTVEQDGTFTYPQLGRIKASGVTLRALEQDLRRQLADGFFKNPQVGVVIEEYKSQQVLVLGEVRTPGPLRLSAGMMLLEAVVKAGSVTPNAGDEALVLRRKPKGSGPDAERETEIVRVNLAKLQAGDLSLNIPLRDGDTVNIPKALSVYVGGEVKTPNAYNVGPGTTVLQAIMLAGGLTDRGSDKRITIKRTGADGQQSEVKGIKLIDSVKPGDTIVVGPRLF